MILRKLWVKFSLQGEVGDSRGHFPPVHRAYKAALIALFYHPILSFSKPIGAKDATAFLPAGAPAVAADMTAFQLPNAQNINFRAAIRSAPDPFPLYQVTKAADFREKSVLFCNALQPAERPRYSGSRTMTCGRYPPKCRISKSNRRA
jgi:hypothetical protein